MAGGKWKKRLDFAWFNFIRLSQVHRLVGISALSLVAYLLFVCFSQTDMSWFLPKETREFHWPDLPQFFVSRPAMRHDHAQETIYTVPSRQLTPRELAEVKAAAAASKPR